MRYLGRVTLDGDLFVGDDAKTAASFELECYMANGVIQGAGEVTATRGAMRLFAGASKVEFLTSDGHRIGLTLADKKSPPEGASAYVVARGDLPSIRNGAAEWATAS